MTARNIFLSLLLLLFSCNPDDSTNNETDDNPVSESMDDINNDDGSIPSELENEILSEEEIEFWDNEESIDLELNEILLSSGQSVEEFLQANDPDFLNDLETNGVVGFDDLDKKSNNYRNGFNKDLIIARLSSVAYFLTTRNNFQFNDEGTDRPGQNGLAYSFGSRIYSLRQKPPAGNCKEQVFGLDCSGFIYQISLKSGVFFELPTWADNQRREEVLKKAIKDGFPEAEDFEVENLGKISASEIQSGDFVYWTRSNGIAFHIGIALRSSNGSLAIAQSNGRASNDCSKNLGLSRGPRFANLERALRTNGGFGSNYGVVRIQQDQDNLFTDASAIRSIYAVNPQVTQVYYFKFGNEKTFQVDLDDPRWTSTNINDVIAILEDYACRIENNRVVEFGWGTTADGVGSSYSYQLNEPFTNIPSELGNLSKLRELHMGWENSNFANLPFEIGQLQDLEILYLKNNAALSTLPKEIGNLINLKKLYLEGCTSLTSIPPEFGNLVNLNFFTLCETHNLLCLPQTVWDLVISNNLNVEDLQLQLGDTDCSN